MTTTAKTFRLAGIMGFPVGQSRSPLIHNHWIAEHGLMGSYVQLPVNPENPQNLQDAVAGMRAMGFAGCNLTMPHKIAALPLVDELDANARRMGAINVLVFKEDGRLKGMNTDGFGWASSLLEVRPTWQASDGPALVLGAGGASRAIVLALMERGATEIRICNRSTEKATQIVREFEAFSDIAANCALKVIPWEARADALSGAALLVNCTNQGMYGQPALELDLAKLDKEALVSDAIYVPLETDLVKRAKARGNQACNGLGMLLHQARPAFNEWFGVMPEVTPQLWAKALATF